MVKRFTKILQAAYFAFPGLILVMTCPFSVKANSGNLFYTHLGNERYEFTFYHYRMCGAISLQSSYNGTIVAGCGNTTITFTRDSIWDVTQTCPTFQNCNHNTTSGSGWSIQRFRAIVNFRDSAFSKYLNASCCDLNIFVTGRVRYQNSNMITSGIGLTLSTGLSLCKKSGLASHNSSSRQHYTWQPINFTNQPIYQSVHAYDTDGDSLSYELVPCLNLGTGNTLHYNAPYTSTYPIDAYCPGGTVPCAPFPEMNPPRGFYLNSETGDLVFQPITSQTSAVAVRINEFRRDSSGNMHKIGYSMVEGYITIANSVNNAPLVSNPRNETICEKQQHCFTYTYSDEKSIAQSVPDTPLVRYFTNIDNYTSQSSYNRTTKIYTVQVCFTAPAYDSLAKPLFFSVAVNDMYCPITFESRRTHVFRVKPRPQFTMAVAKTPGSRLVYRIESPHQNPSYSVSISGPDKFFRRINHFQASIADTLQLIKAGNYYLQTEINIPGYCPIVQYDSVNLEGCLTITLVNPGTNPVCATNRLTLSAQVVNSVGNLQYRWTNVHGQLLGNASTYTFLPDKDTIIRLRIQDQVQCESTDQTIISNYKPNLTFQAPTAHFCAEGASQNWTHLTGVNPPSARFSSSWPGLVVHQNGTYISSPRLNPFGSVPVIGEVFVYYQDSAGCLVHDSFHVLISPSPQLQIVSDTLCKPNLEYPLLSRIINRDLLNHAYAVRCYAAPFSNPGIVVTGNSAYLNAHGLYRFEVQTTDRNSGCDTRDSFVVDLRKPPTFVRTPPTDFCANEPEKDLDNFVLVQTPSPKIAWQALAVTGVRNHPALASAINQNNHFSTTVPGRWRLGFTETSTFCPTRDSLEFTVKPLPEPNLGNDTFLFPDQTLLLNPGNFLSYRWNNGMVSATRLVEARFLSSGFHTVWVEVTDAKTACTGRDTLLIELRQPVNTVNSAIRDIQVMPNPFSEILCVQGYGSLNASLYDINGKKLDVQGTSTTRGLVFSTHQLAPGVYLLEVSQGQTVQRIKVVKY